MTVGAWKSLLRYARRHVGGLLSILLLALSASVLEALKPWPMKIIVDDVLTSRAPSGNVAWINLLPGAGSPVGILAWLAAGTLVLFLAAWGVRLAQAVLHADIGTRMGYELGADVFDRLQRLSLRYHAKSTIGDLVKRVTNDCHCVKDLLLGVGVPLCTSTATLVVVLAVLWSIDATLAMLSLIVLPLVALAVKRFAGPMEDRSYEELELQGALMTRAEQVLSALPVVQAYGQEEREEHRFRDLARLGRQAHLRSVNEQIKFTISTTVVMSCGTAAIMLYGAIGVVNGRLSLGELVVSLSYVAALYAPVETLAYLAGSFAHAAAGARRVCAVLENADEVPESPHAVPVPGGRTRGHLRMQNVSFGYEPERPVLQEITLEALPGQTVAVVGATGAGKSTLVSLIPRFFDPWEGRVTLDGHDVRDLQLASLRSQVALVLQDPFLLPLSIAENIAYGRPSASREDIVAAAVAANAHPFIERLPGSYDAVIGERGMTLSGGERQRLAIARALLKDAPILILDEPTSALDVETEGLLLEALERLMSGRTTFIIAHRLSTIRRADHVVVLDRGRLVEQGSPQALLATPGHFARLQRAQQTAAAS